MASLLNRYFRHSGLGPGPGSRPGLGSGPDSVSGLGSNSDSDSGSLEECNV